MSEQARVLIVEDSETDRALLDAHQSRDGFETEFACDGVEAWQMLDANPDRFDLVLLDRSMPRMNGMELLKRIKSDHRFLIIPVILQSALVARDEVIEGIRAGAYYYLTNPYAVDTLSTATRPPPPTRPPTLPCHPPPP